MLRETWIRLINMSPRIFHKPFFLYTYCITNVTQRTMYLVVYNREQKIFSNLIRLIFIEDEGSVLY